MGKTIGIQKELNEIAEALTVNGFEVTDMFDTNKELDAIIYYNDESNLLSSDGVKNEKFKMSNNQVVRINAAKTNINEIFKILNEL